MPEPLENAQSWCIHLQLLTVQVDMHTASQSGLGSVPASKQCDVEKDKG